MMVVFLTPAVCYGYITGLDACPWLWLPCDGLFEKT
jgi:hypothetical protein